MVKGSKQLPMEDQLASYRGVGIIGAHDSPYTESRNRVMGQSGDKTCQNQASIMFLSYASVAGKPHSWGPQRVFMLFFKSSLIHIESKHGEVS